MTKFDFRKNPPLVREIENIKLPEPGKEILDNDIPVYLINSGTQDVIRIDFIFKAGSYYQEMPLVSVFTANALQEETESFKANEIAEKIDFYGASLKTFITKDESCISLYTLSKYVDKLLPVLQEIILKPVFPNNELSTLVQKQKQEFIVNKQKVNFVARQKFDSLIFGDRHPYGKIAEEEDFDKINKKSLMKFYLDFYRNGKFQIVVSGKIPDDLTPKLNHFFGNREHKTDNTKKDKVFSEAEKPPENHFVEMPDALQTAIRIGKKLFNIKHPDFIPFQVVNTILGGYFGSRLMTNIREDKGYTYGIGSGLMSFQRAGMFFISSEVGNDVAQNAVDEVYFEINRLRKELVPEDELKIVKNYLLGNFLRSADGPFALAELFNAVNGYGLNMDYYQHFINKIRTITSEEVIELAGKYLDPESMVRLMVGKKNQS